ncbi:type I addiction module toxin, SymE family [Erwinia billingiae]|nr:type I addiction module toxin, SymE family [Erwinia billingiae]
MGYIRDQRKFQPSPSIPLKEHWIGNLGFETGKKVEVICGQGELSIRLAEE